MTVEQLVSIATGSDREAALRAIIPQIEAFHVFGGGEGELLGPGYRLETKINPEEPKSIYFWVLYGAGQLGAVAPKVISGCINPDPPGDFLGGRVHIFSWIRGGKHKGWERWIFEGSWQTPELNRLPN